MKILHVFDHSLPLHSGYAFRSESILRALQDRGIETFQLTSPKHPHPGLTVETVESLDFHRCPEVVSGGGPLDQIRCVRVLRRRIKELINELQPDLIHAHSPCLNGLAALRLDIPLVYEVRACWEDAAVSSGTTTEGSIRYRISRALETYVARRANRLVVICEGLGEEFAHRGIPQHRIRVVGNAVNPDALPEVDPERVRDFIARHDLEGRKVLGFFGSFYEYEGLELLIESLPEVVQAVPSLVLLLAGGGEAESSIRRAIEMHNLAAHVKILGRVPHDEIGDCYGAADAMVFPRLRQRLTDMVTPLKPLEANYLRVPVVASDVGGHRELIQDGVTGLLFPAGETQALAAQLIRVLSDESIAQKLAACGYDYVMQERLWDHMAARYDHLYQNIFEPSQR